MRLAVIGLSLVLGLGSVVAVSAPAEAACRYDSDRDSIGRRCGRRSAWSRGATTDYENGRGGSGGSGRGMTAAEYKQRQAKLKALSSKSQREYAAQMAAYKVQQQKRAVQRDAEIAAYMAKSKADAAAWTCQTLGYCY